jgi:hypothetical protein
LLRENPPDKSIIQHFTAYPHQVDRPSKMPANDRLQATARPLPRELHLWMFAVLGMTVLSVGIELFCHFALGLRYPYDWPFVNRIAIFDDLLDWLPQFRAIHTEAFFHQRLQVLYPAPMTLFYMPFYWMGHWALAGYLLLAAAIVGTALTLLGKRMVAAGIAKRAVVTFLAIVLITSYPLGFLLHTANLELVLWAVAMAGVWAFSRGKEGLAATLFGLAASMKFYPIVFLALFLQKKSWSRIVQGVAVAVAATIASLWVIYPHIAVTWKQTQAGTQTFLRRDGMHWVPGQAGFDHTLFSLIKTILPTINPWILLKVFIGYALIVAVIVIWAWCSRVQYKPLLERLTFLTVLIVLLPATSYDYTLVHLYAPWALLVLAIVQGKTLTSYGRAALVCYAVLLTSQAYLIVSGRMYLIVYSSHFLSQLKYVPLSAQLKCLALLGLAISSTLNNKVTRDDSAGVNM